MQNQVKNSFFFDSLPVYPITSFTQYEIDSFQIIFVPPEEVLVDYNVTYVFTISDSLGAINPEKVILPIMLEPRVEFAPQLVKNTGLTLFEGQSRSICSELLTFHNELIDDIHLELLKPPRHGQLVYKSNIMTIATRIPLTDLKFCELETSSLIYTHDDSDNSFSDNLVFKATNRHGKTLEFVLSIEIMKVDDSPPVLVRNIEKSITQFSQLILCPKFLSASDQDSSDYSIRYRVINSDTMSYGELVNIKTNKISKTFTQYDIMRGKIAYKSIRPIVRPVQETIRFTLTDIRGNVSPGVIYDFVINITPTDFLPPVPCSYLTELTIPSNTGWIFKIFLL